MVGASRGLCVWDLSKRRHSGSLDHGVDILIFGRGE